MLAAAGWSEREREGSGAVLVVNTVGDCGLRIRTTFAWLCLAFSLGCREASRSDVVVLRMVTWKPTQPAVWDAAIRRFEAAHPSVRVSREIGPHSSTAFHDLLTQKLKNRDPSVDVFFMDVIWTAEFAAAGWASPLDEILSEEERTRVLPAAMRAATWQGNVYGIPAFLDAGLLFYRKDLLEKYRLPVPSTWTELEAQAREILDGERQAELVGYTGQFQQYEGLVCNMLEFVAANQGRLADDDVSRATLTEPATIGAIRWVRDRMIGGIAPRSVLTYQEPESLALFAQGQAIFHRNWPYAWEVLNDASESRVAGRIGMAPLPHFEHGPSVAVLGGWLYGASAFSRHPREARSFIRFMTSAEMQKRFAAEASLAPTRSDLYADPEILARHPALALQGAVLRLALPRPVTPLYPAVSETLQRFFSRAIARPESDIEGLAREAAMEIDRTLEITRK